MRSAEPKPGGCLDGVALSVLGAMLLLSMVGALASRGEAWRVFVTALAAGLMFVLGRTALRLQVSSMGRWPGVAGACAAGVCLVSLLLLVWLPSAQTPGAVVERALLGRVAGGSGVLALLAADAGALGGFELRRFTDRVVRMAALLCMGLITGLAVAACLSRNPDWIGDLFTSGASVSFWSVFGATTVCTHLATPILARMEIRREQHRRATAADRALLTLQCPRCSLWMQMHSGLVTCPGCRLPLRVEFEEPRCACGYPLHRLQGACCPECGRDIPPEQRWGRGAAQGSAPQAPGLQPPAERHSAPSTPAPP